MEKFYPQVGDKLYLSQRTGSYYVDAVRKPYTVVEVTKSMVKVQECKCIFSGPRYYDTLPDSIEDDPSGKIVDLRWAPKRGVWQDASEGKNSYPEIAFFGEWDFYPYLD